MSHKCCCGWAYLADFSKENEWNSVATWYATFDFSGRDGGTRVVGTLDPHPKGVMRLAKPLLEMVMKGQMQKGMADVKATLERRPAEGMADA